MAFCMQAVERGKGGLRMWSKCLDEEKKRKLDMYVEGTGSKAVGSGTDRAHRR